MAESSLLRSLQASALLEALQALVHHDRAMIANGILRPFMELEHAETIIRNLKMNYRFEPPHGRFEVVALRRDRR